MHTDQPQTSELVFSAHQLTRHYQMGDVLIQALRGIDLELYRGEFVVLLGASGSGKSTLLNILGGLDTASSGELRYGDTVLSQADDKTLTRYRREQVGFVFQFYNLIPSLTALENVALVTDISANPMSPHEALAMVDLTERSGHFPSQLSGGEQQRVAIARAIAKKPRVLLCDEPTGALDSKTGSKVMAVLHQINQQLGTTTLVITHNEAIASMADRVIRLKDGQIVDIEHNPTPKSASELSW